MQTSPQHGGCGDGHKAQADPSKCVNDFIEHHTLTAHNAEKPAQGSLCGQVL
jgi:hypothetical protein